MICFYFVKECPIICLQAMFLNYFEPVPRTRPRRRAYRQGPSAEDLAQEVDNILACMPEEEQYDLNKFDHEKNCVICLGEYDFSDTITQLKCDSRHYFHTECLSTWVRNNNNSCPVCRTVIVEKQSEL